MQQYAFNHNDEEVLVITEVSTSLNESQYSIVHKIPWSLFTLTIFESQSGEFVIKVQKQWDEFQAEYIKLAFGYGQLIQITKPIKERGKSYRKFEAISDVSEVLLKLQRAYVACFAMQWAVNGNWLYRVQYRLSNRSNKGIQQYGTRENTEAFIKSKQERTIEILNNVGRFPHNDKYNSNRCDVALGDYTYNHFLRVAFESALLRSQVASFKMMHITIQLSRDFCRRIDLCGGSALPLIKQKLKASGLLVSDITSGLVIVLESSTNRNCESGSEECIEYFERFWHIHCFGGVNVELFEHYGIKSKLRIELTDNKGNSAVSAVSHDLVKTLEDNYSSGETKEVIERKFSATKEGITIGLADYLTKEFDSPHASGKLDWSTYLLSCDVAQLKQTKYRQQVALNKIHKQINNNIDDFDVDMIYTETSKVLEI